VFVFVKMFNVVLFIDINIV